MTTIESDLERSVADFLAKYPDDIPLEWKGSQRKRDHQVDPVANIAYVLACASEIHKRPGHTRWICKVCGAESPRGIGYVTAEIGPLGAPAPTCNNSHLEVTTSEELYGPDLPLAVTR